MDMKPVKEMKHILIYSTGLLGSSIGLALKQSGWNGKITGLSSERNLKTAYDLGCIDQGYGYDELPEIIHDVDIVFLCSPIRIILKTLDTLSETKLPSGLLITDIGSTKKTITEHAAKVLPEEVTFIGGHPMAGSEKSGPGGADPYMFQNAVYAITQTESVKQEHIKEFSEFMEAYTGCKSVIIDADTHDYIAAAISHIPQLLSVMLVNLAGSVEQEVPGTLQLAAGGFRDMTRIASSPFTMWSDILQTNRKRIDPLLEKASELLTRMRSVTDTESLRSYYTKAHEIRTLVPKRHKGFISPLYEILVQAKDKPGAIYEISGILADREININDIELLKVREGEGGTIRLGFEEKEDARQAGDILKDNGIKVRKRF